ncbi:MAG: hypothetical protein M0P31_01725, partial [Solirubrobacteraceae bacterium]|nr:hypothetical protein [Solirubrobacteraceae bacterium]
MALDDGGATAGLRPSDPSGPGGVVVAGPVSGGRIRPARPVLDAAHRPTRRTRPQVAGGAADHRDATNDRDVVRGDINHGRSRRSTMSLRINTNVEAFNAHRNLSNTS